MRVTLENLPYLCLLWIGLGFIIILTGVFVIAYIKFEESDYTQYVDIDKFEGLDKTNEEEVFAKVLQSKQKKKNQEIEDKTNKTEIYSEIKALYIEGKQEEEIAKILNIGVGEVQLILSLYKMR